MTRLAERLIKVHRVDAAEFMQLMTRALIIEVAGIATVILSVVLIACVLISILATS